MNPGSASLESEPMSTTVDCSCHQVSFRASVTCGHGQRQGDKASGLHLPSAWNVSGNHSSLALPWRPASPPSPSRPLGVPGQLGRSCRQPPGPAALLYAVQMVLPPGPWRFMPVASGIPASPDVPDHEKASPGKAGRRCQGRGPRASAGLDPLGRGLGWRLARRGCCVICVQPGGDLQSQGYRFRVCQQTETLRSEVFKGTRD